VTSAASISTFSRHANSISVADVVELESICRRLVDPVHLTRSTGFLINFSSQIRLEIQLFNFYYSGGIKLKTGQPTGSFRTIPDIVG
jgi:hypothetical protein